MAFVKVACLFFASKVAFLPLFILSELSKLFITVLFGAGMVL